MNRQLSIHSLPFLFTSLLFFAVSLFVLLKNRKSTVNRSFFLLGLSAAVWQFPYFIIYNLRYDQRILFWLKVAYFGLIFITPATYYFIISFLNLAKKTWAYLFYSLSFIFASAIIGSDYIIAGVKKFSWGSCVVPGRAYTIFLILWIIPFLLSLKNLYSEYKKEPSPYNRKRIKYFLLTLPVAYLAMVDSFTVYGLNIYPLGFIPLMFFGLSTAYAIIRYRLLDIEIIIKKGSLIVLGFVASLSLIYVGTFYLQPYFYILGGKNWVIFPSLISLLVGVGLFRFINFVRQIEESELSRRFAYQPILKKEAERISTAKSIEEMVTYIVRDLSSWIRLDYIGIFILDAQNKKFILARSLTRTESRKKMPLNTALGQDDPLIIELLKKRRPLIHSEIEYYLDTEKTSHEEKEFLDKVAKEMQGLETEIAIPSFCEGELLAIISMGHKLNTREIITADDLELLMSLANNIARALYGFMLKKEKTRLIVASQNTIISAIEAKDSYTRGHTDRVAHYTSLIGKRFAKRIRNFSYDIHSLSWSAQLHDVGKIGIPDNILFKAGPLNEAEWAKMKEHPLNGIKIIAPVREWLGEDICAGIVGHHENYDGSGYPFGHKGENIHIFARIIRVADAFDVITSDRPYRPALSKEEALKELKKYKWIYFDPLAVEALEDLYNSGVI